MSFACRNGNLYPRCCRNLEGRSTVTNSRIADLATTIDRDQKGPSGLATPRQWQAAWRRGTAEPQPSLDLADWIPIVCDSPDGMTTVIAWVRECAGDRSEIVYLTGRLPIVSLVETAPEVLAWLQKAAQMAGQQFAGGDDVPTTSAWGWLAQNATDVIARATATTEVK